MDGNHFNQHGISAIAIAPGYAKNHTHQEELRIEDLIRCGDLVKYLIEGVYQHAKKLNKMGDMLSSRQISER